MGKKKEEKKNFLEYLIFIFYLSSTLQNWMLTHTHTLPSSWDLRWEELHFLLTALHHIVCSLVITNQQLVISQCNTGVIRDVMVLLFAAQHKTWCDEQEALNRLQPTGYVMHQQFNIQLYALSTLCLCFVFIGEQTATRATYITNWLVFITEMKSVYCAVRTGSLNKAVCASSLKGQLRPTFFCLPSFVPRFEQYWAFICSTSRDALIDHFLSWVQWVERTDCVSFTLFIL